MPYFNIAMIFTCHNQVLAEETLGQCVEHVETAFFYDQSISCIGQVKLIHV